MPGNSKCKFAKQLYSALLNIGITARTLQSMDILNLLPTDTKMLICVNSQKKILKVRGVGQ